MKKYIIHVIFLPVFILACLSACDKVSPPYKETVTENPGGDTIRKILLEEFTGHK